MRERFVDVPSIICKDCSFGKKLLQKIVVNGHDDVNIYYRVLFGKNPGKVLQEICPHPKEGFCPKKGKQT